MEEQRGGVDQAVDAVEDPAVAANQRAHVLDAQVALDDAHRQVAQLPGDAHDQAGEDQLPGREMGERESQQPGQGHRDRQRPQRALPTSSSG